MSVLMDLLAYNTHYLAFHANMLANEMFLDSTLTRASAVSHAKSLGYTPSSTKSPSHPTSPRQPLPMPHRASADPRWCPPFSLGNGGGWGLKKLIKENA